MLNRHAGVWSLPALLSLIACPALAAAAPPADAGPARTAPPSWCPPGGALAAGRLPASVPLASCDLRGRTVQGPGGLAVTVPDGTAAVTAESLRTDGADVLRVAVDVPAGRVRIERTAPPPPGTAAEPGAPGLTDASPTPDATDGPPATDPEDEPTAAGPDPDDDESGESGDEPEGTGSEVKGQPAAVRACRDRTWRASTSAWTRGRTIFWRYYGGASIEGGISAGDAEQAVRSGVAAAVGARTDCTRTGHFSPRPNIRQHYLGRTARKPGIGRRGGCKQPDGTNSFGWLSLGGLPSSTLAMTCTWQGWRNTVEADVALQSDDKAWWSPAGGEDRAAGGCPAGHYLPAAIVAHETLHVLGLDHVKGARHANLTMTPVAAPCDDRMATLGRGDYRGLIALYGPRR
ncbi:hypothetical protein [Actinomadura parmotrematis]|uniref:Matrixin family metalloprotease n=1 Tax=Actinomadura parmotrematis TaxID=2864039 RepID=A0ABS7G2F8_9ACTN|nr:hypothetical protein [Actinomadura parmotrematis]MBW8486904.1 hypothetical protein [Actinomadura parmotrematis]